MKITVDYAAAACELNACVEKSESDGHWRALLCPDGEQTSMMKRVLAALGGSGRTHLTENGGRVSVIGPDDIEDLPRKPHMQAQRAAWWQPGSHRSVRRLIEWEHCNE
jgi:hypothetical protein